jgi:carboxymethylenebutenolidase
MHQTPDFAAMFDEPLRDEFELQVAAATMTTMTDTPHLYHLPTMAGGNGRNEVFTFYRDHFVAKWPKDTTATHISRTIGEDQLVDEVVMHFTHDRAMDALLPGVAPTGKPVALPVVVVVKFHNGKVAHEHIYWIKPACSWVYQNDRICP